MHKPISLLFVLILSACAAGNKAAKPPETAVTGASPSQPAPRLGYRVFIPSEEWQVLQNVKLQEGLPPAKMLIRHKAGDTFDAVIIVMTSPAALGGPKELATMSRAADEKQNAIITDVTCSEEKPPARCQYRGVAQGKDGTVAAMIVFKSLPETGETAALSGFWKQSQDAAMTEQFEKIVASFSVTGK